MTGSCAPSDSFGAALPCAPPTPKPLLQPLLLTGNTLVFGFLFALGLWSAMATLESAAIADGFIAVESSRKTIQHLEGGIIAKIHVRDGQSIVAGQLLMQLEDTKARTQVQALRAKLWEAWAKQARLTAERDERADILIPAELISSARESSVAQILDGQRKILAARREVLAAQVAVIGERMAQVQHEIAGLRAQEAAAAHRARIIREEYAAIRPLVDKGLQTRPRLLSLEREMAEIDGRRGETISQISRAEQAISESRATILKLQSERQNETIQSLREVESEIVQLTERLEAAADQLSRTEIRAPEAGVITDLRVHTPGGVIGPGAPLLDLVPRADRLIVHAKVKPHDIDVVRMGLQAELHLSAYKQRRVRPLAGVVTYVSADSIIDKRTGQHNYDSRIEIDRDQVAALNGVELVPGMPVSAFIKTGESTVALYALQPILDSFNRAFRED
jgi:HlyD family secretion protein